ncbi:MAG: MBL fold metallo-hydrolase, partial [Planctomycetota bacterium]
MSSSLYFKSLCSSSSGNCLVLWTDHTRVLIDCGLGSMRRTRRMLSQHLGNPLGVDAAIVSHMHGDHIGYYPLRVLEDLGIKVRVHEKCMAQLKQKHFNGYGFSSLRLKPFSDRPFRVGDLTFRPFELPHNPVYPTYGFTVKYKATKVVVATDFNRWDDFCQCLDFSKLGNQRVCHAVYEPFFASLTGNACERQYCNLLD